MAMNKEEEPHASVAERDVEKAQTSTAVRQCATDNRALERYSFVVVNTETPPD